MNRKEKKELLSKRPLEPRKKVLSYLLSFLIVIIFLMLAFIIFINGINFKKNGVELDAKIVSIIDTDEERSIIVEYVYNQITYTTPLKYWSEELDLNQTIKVIALKDDLTDIKTDNSNYLGLSILIASISLLLLGLTLYSFIKYEKERERIYQLLKKGQKEIGVVVAVENLSTRSTYGKLPWALTATIGEEVYNSTSNWINFSIKGVEGYLIDIYIDPDNKANYYLDLITLRRKDA